MQENIRNFKSEEEYLDRIENDVSGGAGLTPKEFGLAEKEFASRLTEIPWVEKGLMEFKLPSENNASCSIEYDSAGEYREVKNIVLKNRGKELDLKELCGNVLIRVNVESTEFGGWIQLLENGKTLINIDADPSTLFGLYILLHELGHFSGGISLLPEERKKRNLATAKMRKGQELSPEEKAEIIKEERMADAFVLRKIRNFVTLETLDKIKKIGMDRGIMARLKSIE